MDEVEMNTDDPCAAARARFPDLLSGESDPVAGSPPAPQDATAEHLMACDDCARELDALRETWAVLPTHVEASPPRAVREAVLAHARSALSTPADRPVATGGARIGAGIADRVRRAAAPLAAAGAALALVALLGARNGLGASGPRLVVLSVLLTAVLTLAALGARERSRRYRVARAVSLAGLAAFAGYALLTVASPIPRTVEFCRLTLFGGADISDGQLCVLYLGVAALYGGIPVGVAAYRWSDPERRWRGGLRAAGLFALLALPLIGLQVGTQGLFIVLSLLGGLLLGATAGGVAGAVLGTRRRMPTTS